MRFTSSLALTLTAALALEAGTASAHPFVVLRDDGTMADKANGPGDAWTELKALYGASGQPLPEVLSVWTTFPMLGNPYATYFVPLGNDVTGINIPKKALKTPPLRAALLHNDVLELTKRSALQKASVEGFANYLFMLEFSHQFGPNILVPSPGPNDLTGFPYHWSFFLETTSPSGGNHWIDNGDGSFTVAPRAPKDVKFSMLDLYLMGIATKDEVGPIEVLTATTVPPTPTDPLFGGAFSAQSFPWFDATTPPLTVQATKRTVSMDDVITANGVRSPDPVATRTWDVGFVLMVPAAATDAEIADATAVFQPIVEGLPAAFAAATGDRGSLHVVTDDTIGAGGGGGAGGATSSSVATTSGGMNGEGGLMNTPLSRTDCTCATPGDRETGSGEAWLAAVVGVGVLASRRRKNVYNGSR
ncbi:MAG: hypothetical protein U0414_02745 [Polyangiaceae bacterium]